MADYRERTAERIVATRERKGYSREELARRADVSVKQLRRIERGESDARLSTVRKLADTLGVAVVDLRPDLEAEENELTAQLQRMEAKLDRLIAALLPPEAEEAVRVAETTSERERLGSSRTPAATRSKAEAR